MMSVKFWDKGDTKYIAAAIIIITMLLITLLSRKDWGGLSPSASLYQKKLSNINSLILGTNSRIMDPMSEEISAIFSTFLRGP